MIFANGEFFSRQPTKEMKPAVLFGILEDLGLNRCTCWITDLVRQPAVSVPDYSEIYPLKTWVWDNTKQIAGLSWRTS